MGFDVVYLPPIHPIGEVNRKGPNNTLVAAPDDVGSPWAIGSAEGGHDAIHPGSARWPTSTRSCAAPTNWTSRSRWIWPCSARRTTRGCTSTRNGSPPSRTARSRYAENPPKRYQDIYPVNFDNDEAGLTRSAARGEHWVAHGVKIFRVDNPHTKRAGLLALADLDGQADPTRTCCSWPRRSPDRPDSTALPARLHRVLHLLHLAHDQAGTDEFGEELSTRRRHAGRTCSSTPRTSCTRPCSTAARPMFALRAALAATLGPIWGVYSGYELYEHQP